MKGDDDDDADSGDEAWREKGRKSKGQSIEKRRQAQNALYVPSNSYLFSGSKRPSSYGFSFSLCVI